MFACIDSNWSAAFWQQQSTALLAMERVVRILGSQLRYKVGTICCRHVQGG